MIESLRGLGYSTSSALADIVDNSITAQASRIDIDFSYAKQTISILDNGIGMSANKLYDAMRLGFINPLAKRSSTDLGRFGCGLKTASFSQCRCLTVASKEQGGNIAVLSWDLDFLASQKNSEWLLLEGPGEAASALLSKLDNLEHGTIVVWERLDRINNGKDGSTQHFLDLIDSVKAHLSLTFHRFLGKGPDRLELCINGRAIAPVDPFMENHPATYLSPELKLPTTDGVIECRGYVLPYKKLLSAKEYNAAAGPDGWTSHQGFYVYRNSRLLVPGSWLSLGGRPQWTKEEVYQLARIKLDIPNSADDTWKIDIKKSRATPPLELREVLTKLATDLRRKSKHIFDYRSTPVISSQKTTSNTIPLWNINKTKTAFKINRDHPAIEILLSKGEEIKSLTLSLLLLIEENVPVQRKWIDPSQSSTIDENTENMNSEEILGIAQVYFNELTNKKHFTSDEAKKILLKIEPFCRYKELVDLLG